MAFVDQVQDLTSLSASDTDELSQFLKDGVIDVTNRWLAIKPQDMDNFTRESAEQTSNGFNPNTDKIVSVIREAGTDGEWYPCTKQSIGLQYLVTDVDSLHYASKYNPVYMITQNRNIHVFPVPSSAGNNGFKALYINYDPEESDGTDLQHDSTGIKWFPDDKVYLVVMYAGIRLLNATMGSSVISLTSVPPDVPSLATISFSESNALSITATEPTAISLGTVSYSDATNADASATAVGAITVATVTKADISGDVPTYTKPGHPAQVSFNSFFESGTLNPFDDSDPGIFSITAVPPDVPTITASTVSFSQAAPTYSKPTVSLDSAPTIGNLTISVSAPTAIAVPDISGVSVGAITIDALPSAPDYVSPTTTISGETWAAEYAHAEVDLATALTALKNNIDLSNAVVDSIPVPPDTPSAPSFTAASVATVTARAISASAPTFTKPTVTGDGDELTDVDDLDTDNTIDVHADQIEFDQWWSTAAHFIEDEEDSELAQLQLQKISTYINAYQAEVQVQLHEFNEANVLYQQDVQEALGEMQIAAAEAQKEADFTQQTQIQEYASKIQKYQAELGVYQAEIGAMSAQSQGYLQTAQGYANEIKTRLSATQVKVSEYQIRVQDALNVFNEGNAVYQAAVQRNLQQAQINMQDAQKEADIDLQEKIQDYTLTLQKFQADIQNYQAAVTDEVQEYQQNLAGDLQVWQAERTTDLQEYASNIQNELNEFNKENAAYQAELQVSIQNAQLEDAEEAKKLQKYGAEVQEYQAEVGAQVEEYTQKFQRYQQEMNTAYTAWAKTESDNLQVFQLDIQNELNEFNKENARYQANVQAELAKHNSDLQKALTQAQLDAKDAQQEAAQTTDIDKFNKAQDQALALANAAKQIEDVIADNNAQVQRFQSMAQHYATQVNEDVQKYTSQLQSDIQTMQGTVANNQTLLTKYQAETVEYQAETAAETQEQSVKMQQYQLLYTQLKAEYDQAFMIAAPQQQQAEA